MVPRLPRWIPPVIILAAITGLLVPLPGLADSKLALAALDSLHFPFFFLLTLLAHHLIVRSRPDHPLWATLAILLVFAVGSELFQGAVGRTASLSDLRNNVMGIAIAAAALKFPSPRSKPQLAALAVSIIAAMAIALVPAAKTLQATAHRNQNFPVLGDFEDQKDLVYWVAQGKSGPSQTTIALSDRHPMRGKASLQVLASASPWAGVHHIPAPIDCSNYSHLNFTITNPGAPFDLGIRIDLESDAAADQVTDQISVATGTHQLKIPIASPTSATSHLSKKRKGGSEISPEFRLTRLVFHLGENPNSTEFFIDRIELQ